MALKSPAVNVPRAGLPGENTNETASCDEPRRIVPAHGLAPAIEVSKRVGAP
jgi:hypothetical protein